MKFLKNRTLRYFRSVINMAILIMTCACSNNSDLSGRWRIALNTQDQEIPFILELTNLPDGQLNAHIINGKETLNAGLVTISGDSIFIPLSIFDAELRGKIDNDQISGLWIKNYLDNFRIPFHGDRKNVKRFLKAEVGNNKVFEGRFSVLFKTIQGNKVPAIGEFYSEDGTVHGTFMTATGDYRFLEGTVFQNKLIMSAFNGESAYLFTADIDGEKLVNGEFWSGLSGYRTWEAERNEEASLPDPASLTFLKEGHDRLLFELPDLNNDIVSIEDDKYKDKALIVQILGTWCPNCLDETVFLSEWYKKNQGKEVEIIGLAFEMKEDFEYGRSRLEKMRDRLGVEYDLLVGGGYANGGAAKALPMLNRVMSYPTTIFIDKNKNVRKIHTGFSGPGTGVHYNEFVTEFNLLMDKLMNE